MRKMLSIAIPAVMAAGLVAAAVNEPDKGLTASEKGKVTDEPGPAVIEVPATAPTTTTTVAPPPPETTTTTAPPVTTTTVKVTPTTRPKTLTASAPKPTTKPASTPQVDCGTGTALANVEGYDTGSDYRIRVTVVNKTNKHIEVDSIVFSAMYPTGERVFNLPVAGQRVPAAADPVNSPSTVVVEVPDSATANPPSSFTAPKFAFHTAGLPQCASA